MEIRMHLQRLQFLNIRHLSARLTAEENGWFLGFRLRPHVGETRFRWVHRQPFHPKIINATVPQMHRLRYQVLKLEMHHQATDSI